MLMHHASKCSHSTSNCCMHVSGGLAFKFMATPTILLILSNIRLAFQSSVIRIYSIPYLPPIDRSCPFHARSAGEEGRRAIWPGVSAALGTSLAGSAHLLPWALTWQQSHQAKHICCHGHTPVPMQSRHQPDSSHGTHLCPWPGRYTEVLHVPSMHMPRVHMRTSRACV